MKDARQNNMRMTRQRRVIFDELAKLKTHPTAEEIYKIVKRKLPKISLGTIYRNLEVLSDSGMILKLEFGINQRRYDGTTEKHYHVRCVKCSSLSDIDKDSVKIQINSVNTENGYRILSHDVEFLGICPNCQQKETKPH